MAHDHSYGLTFLEMPEGYLATGGFTKDINDPEIITVWSNTF